MTRLFRSSAALVLIACTSLAGCGGGSSSSSGGSVTGSISQTGTTGSTGHSSGTSATSGYTISGSVYGITGVSVSLAVTAATATATDSSGNFSFQTLGAGSYTLAPSLAGYVFVPVSRAAVVDTASLTDLNFTASANTAPTYRVAGTVSGSVAGGVLVTLNGSNVGSTITDSSGNYSFAGLQSGTYAVSAALPGYVFTAPLIVSVASADSSTNNFTSATAAAGTLSFSAMSALPEAKVGSPYSSTVVQSMSGGTAPYRYASGSLTAGTPPLGMIVNPSGNLTGTPSVPCQYDFTVCATDAEGEMSACEPTSITVVPAQSGQLPTVSLTAVPSTLAAGASTTLTWASQDATACTASGGWSGTQQVNGSITISPTSTTGYTITCTNAYGSGHAAVLVTVQASGTGTTAPTVSLAPTSAQITVGSTSTLQWSSTNASSCTASGGWKGTEAASGSHTVKPAKTTVYVLTCSSAGGSTQASATVAVDGNSPPPQPTVTLGANAYNITSGESSTLTWTTTNAASCTASDGWSGGKAVDGSTSVSPTATTTYTLSCTGAGGSVQASATVDVGSGQGPPPGTSWVYYNGVFDWPGDYSYVLVPDYHDTTGNPLSGGYDIKVSLTAAYGGWLPYAQNWDFNSQGYTKLTFALKPTVANQTWSVYFVKVGDIPVGISVDVSNYGPAPVVGQWNTYTVPLSDLGVLGMPIYKFCIQDKTGLSNNSWYIDNVGFAP